MNLMMAGIVFAGLTAVYKVRLFTISPASPWAWMVLFVLGDFTYYWFHRISHECRFWWAAHVNHYSSQGIVCSARSWRNATMNLPVTGALIVPPSIR
jgi:sterol desaturase/sphingolipid hydroxylase (fatty acid hydroxylase superfamily)